MWAEWVFWLESECGQSHDGHLPANQQGRPAYRPDDGYGVKNARTATIEPNEQSAIGPTQIQSARRALLQDIELMPQDQDFGFQLPSRLESVAQHTDVFEMS
jgi:hypothetical protein